MFTYPKEHPMQSLNVVVDAEILGGSPVFAGTRVPVRVLFEHLEAGDSLSVFSYKPTTPIRHEDI